MTRKDFQKLALMRFQESEKLLNAGFLHGAYYLAGLGIECAMKACIAKQTKRHDFPPKDINKIYTHNLQELMKQIGLEKASDFPRANWDVVRKWNVNVRYNFEKPIFDFEAFREFLQWLKLSW